MVTLIQLEYIIAVDTHRHFAKAAQKCFVTQPTLSMQIKKLEEHLGVVIFDRSKQPVVPTAIGEKIIEQSRIILRESHKLPQIINSFNDFVKGHLTIGILPTLGPYLVPQIAGSFTEAYPAISIHIKELNPKELLNGLKKDVIDLGITAAPVLDDTLFTKSLFFEEIMLYVNEGKYLKKTDDHISIDELDKSILKIVSKEHPLRQDTLQLAAYLKNTNGKTFFKYEGDSIETLKLLVEKEGGFTFIPEMSAKAHQRTQSARYMHLKDFKPLREIVMVVTKQNPNERLANLLAKHIKENVTPSLLNQSRGKVIGSLYE